MNGTAVSDLINGAFRAFGFLGKGKALDAADVANAFEALNDMLDEANNDRLMIYQVTRNVFPLSSGTQTYTLGTGGTFSMPRPPKVERMSILLTANNPPQEIPIEMLTEDQWQNVTLKSIASYFPLQAYADDAYPLNNINFWPVPSGTCSAVVYAWNVLSAFTSLTQNVSFPPGYKNYMRYGLAIRMAPEYGFEASQTVHMAFANAKDMIRRVNWRPGKAEIDIALLGHSNNSRAIKSQGLVVD